MSDNVDVGINVEQDIEPTNPLMESLGENSKGVLKMSNEPETYTSDLSETANEWNDNSENTIRKWMNNVHETAFTYSYIADTYRTSRRYFNSAAFILGIFVSVLAAVVVAIGVLDLQWPVFGINITILVLGGFVTFFSGYSRINNWDDRIQDYDLYTERLGSLWIEFRSVMDISRDQRTRAIDFIKHMHGKYIILIQQGPGITVRESEVADKKYQSTNPPLTFCNRFG